ncbi:MAG: hypothetical protein J6K28_00205 [Alistipes sp.]|nr:hypothetical protein [Alistipes sp.]
MKMLFAKPFAIAVSGLLCLAACTDGIDYPSRNAGREDCGRVLVSASAPSDGTRTHSGETADGRMPVYWSDGDVLNVNGVNSSPLALDGRDGVTSAQFELKNVAAPYYALYPDAIFVSSDNGYRTAVIDIPVEQAYAENSFAEGSAILYGSAAEGETVALKNLCGGMRLSLTGNGTTVGAITVTSADGRIAGRFGLDLETGALTAIETSSCIRLTMPDGGVALSSVPRDFYVMLPEGDYPDGFEIKIIEASSKKTMNLKWTRTNAADAAGTGVAVKAGRIADFGNISYAPTHREILSADDFIEFAAAADGSAAAGNSSGGAQGDYSDWIAPDGEVKLCADISLPATVWYADASLRKGVVTNWYGIFDGGGHTITIAEHGSPLFYNIYEGGAVKNLTVAGHMVPASGGQSAPGCCCFAGYVYGGEILSCVNEADIEAVLGINTAMAAFARQIEAGTIADCENRGDITLRVNTQTNNMNAYAGGIVSIIGQIGVTEPRLSGNVVIRNCRNDGDVKIEVLAKASAALNVNWCAMGGIAGWLSGGDAERYASIVNCENNGDLLIASPANNAAASSGSSVGGIVGWAFRASNGGQVISFPLGGESTTAYDGFYFEMSDCRNYGTVSARVMSAGGSSSNRSRSIAGGLVGTCFGKVDRHVEIRNCANYGQTDGGNADYARSYCCCAAGGLIGCGGFTDIAGCRLDAQIGDGTNPMFCAGGVFGIFFNRSTVEDCTVVPRIRLVNQDWEYCGLFAGAAGTMITRDTEAAHRYMAGTEFRVSRVGGRIWCRTSSRTIDREITRANYMSNIFCDKDASTALVTDNITVSDISLSD